MSKKLNPIGKFVHGMSKLTEMIYDQYELATTGEVTPTSRHTDSGHTEVVDPHLPEQQVNETVEVHTPIQEEYNAQGLIKATAEKTIKVSKKLPIEIKIVGKTKSLAVELRSSFLQFIVAKEYNELTKKEYVFSNILQDENEVQSYYNALKEFATTKGFDVTFQ